MSVAVLLFGRLGRHQFRVSAPPARTPLAQAQIGPHAPVRQGQEKSKEVEPVLVQDVRSMPRRATPSDQLLATWVRTQPRRGGLEMRWVSRLDPSLDRCQGQAGPSQAPTPA
jgi:hypothetical protein